MVEVGQDLHEGVSLDLHVAGGLQSEALSKLVVSPMTIGSKGEPNNQEGNKPRESLWVTNVPVEEFSQVGPAGEIQTGKSNTSCIDGLAKHGIGGALLLMVCGKLVPAMTRKGVSDYCPS